MGWWNLEYNIEPGINRWFYILLLLLLVLQLCKSWPAQQFSSIISHPHTSYSTSVYLFFPDLLWHHPPNLTSLCQSFLCNWSPLCCSFRCLSFSILTMCPIHLILYGFVYLTIYAYLINKSVFLKFLFSNSHFDFLLGHITSSLLSFQTLLIFVHVRFLVPRSYTHMWLLVLSDFYSCAF
jgi:hypothetical protein